MGVVSRVVQALFPAPNPRAELWAAMSESERIEDAGKALDRIDSHVRSYRRLLLSEAGFDPDEFPFDEHGVKPAVHPIDARYLGGHRLVVEPIPVASVAAGGGAGAVSDSPTTPAPAPNTEYPELDWSIHEVLFAHEGYTLDMETWRCSCGEQLSGFHAPRIDHRLHVAKKVAAEIQKATPPAPFTFGDLAKAARLIRDYTDEPGWDAALNFQAEARALADRLADAADADPNP